MLSATQLSREPRAQPPLSPGEERRGPRALNEQVRLRH